MNPRKATTTALLSLALLAAGLTIGATPALALFTHVYSGHSFGPDGTGPGTFQTVFGVAVDQASQDVYVLDSEEGKAGNTGRIYKFNAAGEPVNFEALGSNAITGFELEGADGFEEIAVDDSCFLQKLSGAACEAADPANGDIYLARYSEVRVYNAKGEFLEAINYSEIFAGSQMRVCGVAVGVMGEVYLDLTAEGGVVLPGVVEKYIPKSNPVTAADYTSSLFGFTEEACNIAVDSTGLVYVAKLLYGHHGNGNEHEPGLITKYEGSQFNTTRAAAVGTQEGAVGMTLATDPFSNEVYIDNRSGVSRYSAAGEFLEALGGAAPPGEPERPGTLDASYGVAVDGTTGVSGSGDVYAADGGSGRVNIYSPGVAFGAPLVSTGAADGAERTSVQLLGTVNPAGPDTSYHFEYVNEAGYQAALAQGAGDPYAGGGSTASVEVGGGGGVDSVETVAHELLPETTYHYALVAVNALGSTTGADGMFTTASRTPPVVVTDAAGGVSQNAASISGTVDSLGLQTSYGFEIGLVAGEYGPPTGLGSVGAGASEVVESLGLTGLQPGTTYHYRIMASNLDGASYGADQSFTTSSYPDTFVEPPAPLPFVAVPAIAFPAGSEVGVVKPRASKKTRAKGRKRSKRDRRTRAGRNGRSKRKRRR
jgi:hypothetical protein